MTWSPDHPRTDPFGWLDAAAAAAMLPTRHPRGHKGTFGRVVAVAGSLDYAGAGLMAGTAALRAGCGLVTLCLPRSLQPLLVGRVPELITRGLPEVAPFEVEPLGAAAVVMDLPADALLLGPGLLTDRASSRLVQRLLAGGTAPAVVDAGALAALAAVPRWWTRVGRAIVVTPHPGEFARLGYESGTGDDERRAAASAAASAWQAVVVLKGAHTVIADPGGRLLVAPFDLPLLGSGGTGDVLAGIIVSLLAQGLAPFEAASLGVYLHARAGAELGTTLGDAGLLASDLLPLIPLVRLSLVEAGGR